MQASRVPKIEDMHPELFQAVKQLHEDWQVGEGHQFDHVQDVSQIIINIGWGDYPERDIFVAAAAGLGHNFDWCLGKKQGIRKDGNIAKAPAVEVEQLVVYHFFKYTSLSREEMVKATNYVMGHATQLMDDPVYDLFTDGDKLANMMLTVIPRGGQHAANLQIMNPIHGEVDPSDRTDYEKYCHPDSLFYDFDNCAGWPKPTHKYKLKTPKAIEIGREWAAELKLFMERAKAQKRAMGLML